MKLSFLKKDDKYFVVSVFHKPFFNSMNNLSQVKEKRLEEFMYKLNTIIYEYRNSTILDIISNHKDLIIIEISEPKIKIDLIFVSRK